ncbi:hypothetical protein P7D73_18095 [Enterococcus raffinosus]|uniref:hypothetical protein n=1 Tax=Enterococcus raffinosus TaxID=71452 RepID=UPI00288E990A|nr:hypothetical protein [Enterococcus raffinosus]MDT2525118.1 hypothetical protein [Enterococcus raffinosus]MDT2592473.1 hypothetical protein [Enterococcus raffinosus]
MEEKYFFLVKKSESSNEVEVLLEKTEIINLELQDIYSRIDSDTMEIINLGNDLILLCDENGSFKSPTYLINYLLEDRLLRLYGRVLIVTQKGSELQPLNRNQADWLIDKLQINSEAILVQ